MDYDFVRKVIFKTLDGKQFRISDFDFIENYICKYLLKNESKNKIYI